MHISILKNQAVSDKKIILNNLSKTTLKEKEIIIRYLSSRAFAVYAASAPALDIISGDYSEHYGRAGYSDGQYEWTSEEIMYFEKYNLKLDDDFIQHVLNNADHP